VMMALGFLAGLTNWYLLGRKQGRDLNFCSDLLFWAMVAGVLGARAAFVFSEWPAFARDPLSIVRVDQGGLVFYGGFIAAVGAVAVFAIRRGIRVPELFDFAATSVPLAHAFGRVGCFLNGCCYGRLCKAWWGVRYPAQAGGAHESAIWRDHLNAGFLQEGVHVHSLPVHPVQLYEAGLSLVLFAALVWMYRRKHREGTVASAYLVGYAAIRFAAETFRGDWAHRMQWLGLSSAQWVSVGIVAVVLAWGGWNVYRGKRNQADG